MRRFGTFLFAFAITFLPHPALADPQVTIDYKPNTFGLGLEVSAPVGRQVDLRFLENGAVIYTTQRTSNPILNVTADILLQDVLIYKNYGLFADLHPKYFHQLAYSLGVINNNNFTDALSVPTSSSVTFGNTTYSAATAGTVDTHVFWQRYSPYVGIRYNTIPLHGRRHYGAIVELGGVYQGKPLSTLTATGTIGANPNIVGPYLAKLRTILANRLSPYQVYPMFGVGFGVKI